MGKCTWTTKRAHELASLKGGFFLSNECMSATKKVQWQCFKNHIWEATPTSINQGSWCPWCSGHKQPIIPETQIKQCSCCKEMKPFDSFVRDVRKKWGVTADCKTCRSNRSKKYRNANPEKVRALRMTPEQMRVWRQNNPAKNSEYGKRWRAKNHDHINAAARRLRQTSIHYKILSNLRGRLNDALKRKGAEKIRPISDLMGCSISDLKIYLSARFREGMTWQNYGKGAGLWHIDHIKPCASFDLRNEEEQKNCFHFSNLQPLWESDNLRKGANIKALGKFEL